MKSFGFILGLACLGLVHPCLAEDDDSQQRIDTAAKVTHACFVNKGEKCGSVYFKTCANDAKGDVDVRRCAGTQAAALEAVTNQAYKEERKCLENRGDDVALLDASYAALVTYRKAASDFTGSLNTGSFSGVEAGFREADINVEFINDLLATRERSCFIFPAQLGK